MKNLAGFIFPHPNTPKTHPVLGANPRRETFWGVCNTPYTDTPKTCPILGPNLRRRTFRGVCNTPLHRYAQNLAGFIFPHTDTPKTRPVLDANPCRRIFGGVCNTPLHGYVQNLTGFRRKPSAQDISGRMQYAPTRVYEKFGGFHISPHDMARNPAGFGLCHST